MRRSFLTFFLLILPALSSSFLHKRALPPTDATTLPPVLSPATTVPDPTASPPHGGGPTSSVPVVQPTAPATSAVPASPSVVQPPPAQPTTTAAAATTAAEDPVTEASSSSATITFSRSSVPNNNPQTTLYASFSFSVPNASSAPGSVVSAPPLSASSKGFWRNKGAVGATFTFITLIVIAAVAGVTLSILKRRRRARHRRQRYLEKYNAAQAKQVANDASTDGHFEDAEPAVNDPMAAVPTTAYPDRQVHYGATAMSQVDQNSYDGGGVGYILGSDYNSQNNAPPQEQTPMAAYYQGGYQQPGTYQQTGYQQGGAYQAGYGQANQYTRQPPSQGGYGQASQYTRQPSYQQTKAAYSATPSYHQPQSTRTTGLAPPVAPRQPAARGNGYEQSIDSFYGASGAENSPTHAV